MLVVDTSRCLACLGFFDTEQDTLFIPAAVCAGVEDMS